MTATATRFWDEPAKASSPRGWLMQDKTCVGFYLDYGPEHYRSPHSSPIHTLAGEVEVIWCRSDRQCPTCQPGNILAVRYPNGPGTDPRDSRYVETVEAARRFVEVGR